MDDGQELKPVSGLWQVVDETNVEYRSMEGWSLVKIVAETHIEYGAESVPLVVPGQSYTTQGSGSRSHTVQKNRYVMFKDEKSAIAQLNAEAKQQYIELRDTQTKVAEQEKAIREMLVAYTKLTEQEKQHAVAEANSAEQARKNRDMIYKMEKDIAKIRAAIGELKMKEILAS